MLVLRTPIAFALGLSAAVGIFLLRGYSVAANSIVSVGYSAVAKQSLIIVPLFVLLGGFAFEAGIARDVYGLLARFTGRFRSSMAIATVLAAAGFAAVTGSSVATVAALAKNSIEEMEERGFQTRFAAGLVACSGTLGVLIPPSVVLAVYGVVAGESIGRLLVAGILPGILSALAYLVLIVVMVRLFPRYALTSIEPRSSKRHEAGIKPPRNARLRTEITGSVLAAIIFGTIMGGIFTGQFTATESAAVGAFVAGVVLIARQIRRPKQAWASFFTAARETTSTVGMLFALIVGGTLFTYFLVSARVPGAVTNAVANLDVPPYAILALFLLIMVPLGAVLDGFSIILITVPLMHPIVTGMGFDGIWFGILVVKLIEFGLVTPPVGLNAFVISGVVPRIPVGTVFRGVLPFYVADIIVVVLLVAFPQIVTALPAMVN